MSTETVPSWMERTNELPEGKATNWKTFGIWTNLAGFFKALPENGLVENGKKAKGGKKSKLLTAAFLLMQLGKKSTNPLSSGRVNSHAVLRNWRIRRAQLMFTIF